MESYGDLLRKQDLMHTKNSNHIYQPIADTLGAYGNDGTADTVWYALGETEEDSELLAFPVAVNFTDRTIDTEDGKVVQVSQYGGDYDSATLPESVEDALLKFWRAGDMVFEDEYEDEAITVTYKGISQDRKFIQCYADVTPLDYPEITIRYEVMLSLENGSVTDAKFGLKEYN